MRRLDAVTGMALLGLMSGPAMAGDAPQPTAFARELCSGLSGAVQDASPAGRPVFLASYRPGLRESAVPLPLRSSAFTYDNALAAIALVACGDRARARQIGDALLHAVANDRTFADGRVRNAYRAGIVAAGEKALLPGWWDQAAGIWAEDSYQDGSATGNVAWAALALLTLHGATGEARDLSGAGTLLRWIDAQARAKTGSGFTGGQDGYDPAQTALTWASTEHNVDVAAAVAWHRRAGGDGLPPEMESSARRFVQAAFAPALGCFRLGTTPEGAPADTGHLALDTQLWPLLIADAPADWRAALACAETRLSVPGGFDFDNDRDGVWVEGTAQAALVYKALGESAKASGLLAGLRGDLSPSGWLYATRGERLTTGLKIGPQSTTADFFYFKRPHLGATAWAALAALGWNPFLGQRTR